jgi:hypothetical protein
MKIKLIQLMKEIELDQHTINGAMKLLKTETQIKETIQYIKKYKTTITNHQMRQFIVELINRN